MDSYYKIPYISEIADRVYTNKDKFKWYTGRRQDQHQVMGFSQTYIAQDSFLRYISKKIPGTLRLFKFPPNCYYRWHRDGDNLYNFNLTFTSQEAFVLFENTNKDTQIFHTAITPVSTLRYESKNWYLFNADTKHSVYNLDTEWRYLLTYTVPRTTEISYLEALELCKKFVAGPERFELPTAGFEDQHSSTELRTDVPEVPLTRDGTIIDDLIGGRLHLPR